MNAFGLSKLVTGLAISGCCLLLASCGDSGLVSTKEVKDALESTGYDITYTDGPERDGYQSVAGYARWGPGKVAFAIIVADHEYDGTYGKSQGGSPAPPVVKFQDAPSEQGGNLLVATQPQSAFTVQTDPNAGRAWLPSAAERKMDSRISTRLRKLADFGPA